MFKDIFKQLIQKSGLSSYQISKDTGISESLISQWRSGRQLPKYDSLNILANYFNVSGDYLLGRTDPVINPSTVTLEQEYTLSDHEKNLLTAYRKNSDIQFAVDKLLGINNQQMRAIKIARSNTSKVTEITGDFSDLFNAPRVLSDDDI